MAEEIMRELIQSNPRNGGHSTGVSAYDLIPPPVY